MESTTDCNHIFRKCEHIQEKIFKKQHLFTKTLDLISSHVNHWLPVCVLCLCIYNHCCVMSIAIMYIIFNFHVLEHMQFLDSALNKFLPNWILAL